MGDAEVNATAVKRLRSRQGPRVTMKNNIAESTTWTRFARINCVSIRHGNERCTKSGSTRIITNHYGLQCTLNFRFFNFYTKIVATWQRQILFLSNFKYMRQSDVETAAQLQSIAAKSIRCSGLCCFRTIIIKNSINKTLATPGRQSYTRYFHFLSSRCKMTQF